MTAEYGAGTHVLDGITGRTEWGVKAYAHPTPTTPHNTRHPPPHRRQAALRRTPRAAGERAPPTSDDLTDEQIERLGLALMRLEEAMTRLKEHFDLDDHDLNLGPLGPLLPDD